MIVQLNRTARPFEFSVGELFAYGDMGNLEFNVGVYYNEETEKYEPTTEVKDATETLHFTVDGGYFADKHKCRFMQMMKDDAPGVEEMKAHFLEVFNRYIEMRKHAISNHLVLTLNYFDPLYNYDRMEVYDENTKTDYKGSETDTTNYNGSEKNTFERKGLEQRGTTGYDSVQEVGEESSTNEVTGYNSPNDFTNESRTTTKFGGTTNVAKSKINISGSGGNNRQALASDGNMSGRITKNDHEVIETTTYDGRSDTNELTYTNRNDATTKTFNDRQDETSRKTNNHLFGNIGVTTSTALQVEYFKSADIYAFVDTVMLEFLNDYTFIM